MGIRLLLLLLLLLVMATLAQSEKTRPEHIIARINASPADLVFVLDRSSYVSDYVTVTENFVLNLTSNLNSSRTRVAVVRYGTRAEVVFSDLKHRRPGRWCELRNAVANSRNAKGYSALTDALYLTENLLLDSTSRQKYLILITGSRSNVGKSPLHQAFRLKSLLWTRDGERERVQLYVLGFGSASRPTLETMVAPHRDRFSWSANVQELEAVVRMLALIGMLTPAPPACSEEIVFPADGNVGTDSVEAEVRTSLTAITVCLWARPGHGGAGGTAFSYSRDGRRDGDIFTLTNIGDLELSVYGERVRTNVTLLSTLRWHHVCVQWRDGGDWSIHVNGTLSENGVLVGGTSRLEANGTFELGQLARPPSGHRDSSDTFRGSMSRVNVYSTLLSHTQIRKLASEETPCNYLPGDVISWPDLLGGIQGTSITKAKGRFGAEFDWCPETRASSEKCAIGERCWARGDLNVTIVCECDRNEQLSQTTYEQCEDQSYCHGNGLCVVEDDEPNCLCHFGFHGDECQTTVCDKCRHGVTCSGDTAPACNCTWPYLGPDCGVMYKPECVYEPCSVGNGTCSLTDDAEGYHCQCSNKDLGPNCQAMTHCDASPCPEGAICKHSVDNYQCLQNETESETTMVPTTRGRANVISEVINVKLRLQMKWNENLSNDVDFKRKFVQQVESLFAATYEGEINVDINAIWSGSVIVDFNIQFYDAPGTQPGDPNAMTAERVEATFRRELRKGAFGPFNATESDLLGVTVIHAIPQSVNDPDKPRLGLILGCTVAAFVVVVCIAGTVYYRLRSQNEFEQMSERSKATIGYDLTELSSPIARSTPKPISPSPVSSFFRRWSTRGQHRSDTLQTLMNNGDSKDTLRRDVITIEIHDNLGFLPDQDTLSRRSLEFSHTSLVTRPPPSGENDELSLASSDTLKPGDTAVLDDSDLDSSVDGFDYNEELARSLKELDRVCSDENLNLEQDLQTPPGAFSLRREEIVTNIDDVELSDEAETKTSPRSPTRDDPKFTFLSHVMPNFEVIPTLQLPAEPASSPPPIRSRTYSEQQRCLLACFERQNFEYF